MDPASISSTLSQATAVTDQSASIEVGYGGSLTSQMGDSFAGHLKQAEASLGTSAVSEPSATAKALFKPFDRIDHEAEQLAQYATEATASGQELSASEIVMLTVRSQEFMFHSQLTANVANRTADGLQQLFKQQG